MESLLTSWNFLFSDCSCHGQVHKQQPTFSPLNPKSDQHLISPYGNTAESFIKIMRIKGKITNQRSFDCSTNSPCQHPRKCTEKRMENVEL